MDPRHFDPEKVCELIAEHPGKIVALKIRLLRNIVGSHGYRPLEAALVMAEKTKYGLAMGLGLTTIFYGMAIVAILFLPETRHKRINV